ncbi:glycosyltransferase [Lyngbya aestuarii]|uniref:glycosyltransferase n=1 Tax=Lyngbya aestuarii TaxID=118322 RepID=UPI00403E0D93
MKITFVLPHASMAGGVRVVAIYAEHLKRRGHEVCVVSTPRTPLKVKEKFKSLLKGNGWPTDPKPGPSHLDNVDVPHKIIDHLPPVVENDLPDADLVVATWWTTAEWVASLSEAKGAKAYFIQHHEVFDYLPKDRVEATYSLPLHKITISKWLLDLMQNRYGDSHVSLIPNSVDTKQFYAPPRGKQSMPTVGMLYSPIYWKGCDISLKAFALAAQEIPNLRLVAFGNNSPSPDLPLPKGTEYVQQPQQNRIKDIYASCDVWLCGSRSEGFHLPPLEAMACRCPVLSTQVGGPVDIIENGVNGYLVPIEDHNALAKHLVKVLSLSDAEWQAMSNAAYATATRYTWDDATDLFEAALHTTVERTQRGDFSSANLSKNVSQ